MPRSAPALAHTLPGQAETGWPTAAGPAATEQPTQPVTPGTADEAIPSQPETTGATSATQGAALRIDINLLRGDGHDAPLTGGAGAESFIGSAGNEHMQGRCRGGPFPGQARRRA